MCVSRFGFKVADDQIHVMENMFFFFIREVFELIEAPAVRSLPGTLSEVFDFGYTMPVVCDYSTEKTYLFGFYFVLHPWFYTFNQT
jgi:hypothetical protein